MLTSQSKSTESISVNSTIIFNKESKIIHCSLINEETEFLDLTFGLCPLTIHLRGF